ncbi:hypothetical protein SAMN05421823_102662 [Catalinimonas alkaloidigena]|uniref:Uncharacterized protein n=1 Tax=Catalinimonas alkaloidigena TaxID=1075417 RepID=A0A1G9BMU4_9BACT|nr:hypothetical protein [Catalinimonas alkaloidigena]SDK40743.1 hypothetical protein SAMN05421823_102662 [Catalinimonas alkaloidigena]
MAQDNKSNPQEKSDRPYDHHTSITDIEKNKDKRSPEDEARLEGPYGFEEPDDESHDEEE